MSINKLTKDLVLHSGTIIDPYKNETYKADMWIRNGKIHEIGKFSFPKSAQSINCEGKVVTHGFCDIHVHFREPGEEYKETLETGSHAALAGGFTRVCAMPNTNPKIDSPELINFIYKKAEGCPIYIHPIGAVTKNQAGKEIAEMGLMYKAGAVAFSDDGIPIQDGAVMRTALEYSRQFDVPIINHAEDLLLRNDGLMNEGNISMELGLRGNPVVAESTMVYRDLELAHFTSGKIHVPHVTTKNAIDIIRGMKKINEKVTAEVTPHHLFFNDESLRSYDTNLKVAPPIRAEIDRDALIKAVKDGTVDCIATDHAPHAPEDKETTFDIASFGMIGLESCFGAVNFIFCKNSGMPLEHLIKLLTIKPRQIMGFKSDLLLKGTPAEITILEPDVDWVFNKKNIFSKSKNSPFIGKKLYGKIYGTISRSFLFRNL